MNLLDLPGEILCAIVQQYYGPWSIRLCDEGTSDDIFWRLKIEGIPPNNLILTCRKLNILAKEAETRTFSGQIFDDHGTMDHPMGTMCNRFVNSVRSGQRLEWLKTNVKVIRFRNQHSNPAVWSFPRDLHHFPNFPALERIELDCRYPFHFAIHNVESMRDFLANRDGRLAREMDFRYSFFLSCERFLRATVFDGIDVRVIRAMGVREGKNKCQAVAVAVNYVQGDDRQLALDWSSLRTSSAEIDGWPHNIRSTAESLSI